MRPSIHSSTAALRDSGVWLRESIGAPISTVTVPGLLRKAPRPKQTCVVSDRHDGRPAVYGEPCSAKMVPAPLAGLHPSAFRKDGDTESLRETLSAQLRHAPERAGSAAAVDRDRTRERESPPEERDPQQPALHHQKLRRKDHLEGESRPRRLMRVQTARRRPR